MKFKSDIFHYVCKLFLSVVESKNNAEDNIIEYINRQN